jgi:positive regulator of sigma E activity
MEQPLRTPRDEYYINSTSFEVYMVVGLVFVLGFTFSFIGSVMIHQETLVWPGMLISMGAAYWVLRVLSRRERNAKIREVDGE